MRKEPIIDESRGKSGGSHPKFGLLLGLAICFLVVFSLCYGFWMGHKNLSNVRGVLAAGVALVVIMACVRVGWSYGRELVSRSSAKSE